MHWHSRVGRFGRPSGIGCDLLPKRHVEWGRLGGWGTNASSGDTQATFGYNYSADGIPEAPNSQGGDPATRGVKMESNISAPTSAESLTVYPTGQNFTGNYTLRFDAWMNYDAHERINGGSAATTEFLGGGIGYDNLASDIGTTGVHVLSTGDGGSGSDWRIFADGAFQSSTAMAAGSRNGADPYYVDFLPGTPPPLAQAQISHPAGVAGSPGFQWITWEITTFNNMVSVFIEKPGGERLKIIDFDKTVPESAATTDGNIGLTHADFFSSVTPRPDLAFGVIDNVVVSDAVVPEPGTTGLLALTLGAALAGRRRRV